MPQSNPRLDRTAFARPIAHRGLHDAGAGRIENTAAAFQSAIAGGYGIECDLRAASCGVPVVFHDATLDRLTDATGPVSALTATDLARLRHRGTDAGILTLADCLDLVGGAVPQLVEVKSEWQPPDLAFLTAIAHHASHYRGPIGLMSFDPTVMAALQALAPTVPRGLVSGSYRTASGDIWWADCLSPEEARRLRDLTDFDAIDASFCAYEVAALPTAPTAAIRVRGLPVFAWTVRSADAAAQAAPHADAIIFEGFAPAYPATASP